MNVREKLTYNNISTSLKQVSVELQQPNDVIKNYLYL